MGISTATAIAMNPAARWPMFHIRRSRWKRAACLSYTREMTDAQATKGTSRITGFQGETRNKPSARVKKELLIQAHLCHGRRAAQVDQNPNGTAARRTTVASASMVQPSRGDCCK